MQQEQFLELVTKKLSGEATREELDALACMLQSSPDLRRQMEVYVKFWEEKGVEKAGDTERALQKVLLLINDEQMVTAPAKIVGFKKWLRIAAVLVVFVGIAAVLYLQRNTDTSPVANLLQKQNAKGVKSTIELADGSKIWLNADSKIQYPTVFGEDSREVYLNGEAFFDIAKNPAKPFIIHLANGTVRVLGTSFNVKAYDNEQVIETSVATGKVAFIPKGKQQKDTIFLTPNNKLVFRPASGEISTAVTLSEEDKAWTEGRLVFRSMLFADIAVELERNFGKKVVFRDEETKDYRLTGSFQNNTLAEIFYYLSKTKSFNYTISDEQIIISR